MSAPLRIKPYTATKAVSGVPPTDKAYMDRLLKLIPAEIVALYLAGKVQIAAQYPVPESSSTATIVWAVWTAVCLVVLVLVRRWATSDGQAGVPPEWPAIGLTAVAFLIWIYSLGDVFQLLGLFNALLASLLVLVWTTVVPLFYKPMP